MSIINKERTLNSNTNNSTQEQLRKLYDDYERTIHFINNLKDLHSNPDVIIPITEGLAYFKGKMTDIQRCHVHLGAEFFLHTTNSKSIEILKRRQETIQSKLGLNPNERKTTSIVKTSFTKLDEDVFEITEEYDKNQEIKHHIEVDQKDINILEHKAKEIKRLREGTQDNSRSNMIMKDPKEILKGLIASVKSVASLSSKGN